MATKREVKAIINSKKLTGYDAARLMMRDLWETDHNRPGLLTEAEIQQLRSNVSRLSSQDVEDFNSWLELYRIISYTLKETEILALTVQVSLLQGSGSLRRFAQAWVLKIEQYISPTVVTEQQLKDLKCRWRDYKLQRLYCLGQVIWHRMCAKDDRAALGEIPDEEFDRLWHECAAEIEELIAGGRLEPVELELRADDDRLRGMSAEPLPAGCENIKWHPAYHADGVAPEEVDRLQRSYLSGERLYQASLPEWQEDIDGEYVHVLAAEDLALPEAEHGSGVAVLQELARWPVELDEKGHYKASDLVRLSGVPAMEESADIKQSLRQLHSNIRRQLRVFLAFQPILEALSEVVGFKLDEDLEVWMKQIEKSVSQYKGLLELPVLQPLDTERERAHWAAQEPEWLKRKPELPSFTIDDLKPDPEHVQHLKERMSIALGEDCYKVFRTWLLERGQEIENTEGKLAEEVSQDEEA
jgi:hypothetical protein